MSFNLRDFIKKGLMNAVGHMADYQVILNAAGWHEKGVLTEEDLAEVQVAIDAKNFTPDDAEKTPYAGGTESEADESLTAVEAESEKGV